MLEMAVPFRLDVGGGITAVSDPSDIAGQHVLAVIGTNPGERVMRLGYGVGTRNYLFHTLDDLTTIRLTTEIESALRLWEPTVVYQGAGPEVDLEHGTLTLWISFSVRNSPSAVTGSAAHTVALRLPVGGSL